MSSVSPAGAAAGAGVGSALLTMAPGSGGLLRDAGRFLVGFAGGQVLRGQFALVDLHVFTVSFLVDGVLLPFVGGRLRLSGRALGLRLGDHVVQAVPGLFCDLEAFLGHGLPGGLFHLRRNAGRPFRDCCRNGCGKLRAALGHKRRLILRGDFLIPQNAAQAFLQRVAIIPDFVGRPAELPLGHFVAEGHGVALGDLLHGGVDLFLGGSDRLGDGRDHAAEKAPGRLRFLFGRGSLRLALKQHNVCLWIGARIHKVDLCDQQVF